MTSPMFFALMAVVFVAPQLPPGFARWMAVASLLVSVAVRMGWIA